MKDLPNPFWASIFMVLPACWLIASSCSSMLRRPAHRQSLPWLRTSSRDPLAYIQGNKAGADSVTVPLPPPQPRRPLSLSGRWALLSRSNRRNRKQDSK